MSAIQFHLLAWPEACETASAVRRAVFIVEQGVPADLEWDAWDSLSLHCLAIDDTCTVRGTGRLLPDDDRGTARIGRMAVLPESRGLGIGAGILDGLSNTARQRGARCIELHAQTHAAAFYSRYGFRKEGDIFDEAGIPHVTMVRIFDSPD